MTLERRGAPGASALVRRAILIVTMTSASSSFAEDVAAPEQAAPTSSVAAVASSQAPVGGAESQSTVSASVGVPATRERALTATPEDEPTTRTPLPLLQERFVGVASRATRFDWLIERNNFASVRLGVLGRKALGDLVVEGAVSWANSFATSGSELIALTPYRQAGRPARLELEANVAWPLAEASTTASLWFLPPAEIVVNAIGGARYLLYPQLFLAERPSSDLPFGVDAAVSVVSPVLSDSDVQVLERDAVPGMAIDRARLQTLLGLGTDVYFPPGVFVTPRALLAVPLLSPFSSTSVGWWWEMSAVVGFAW
jgi:hypothetical protein